MKLTHADHLILESYKSVLNGLSTYFGPGYEIILHSLEDYSHSAIKVINGHYSGRSEGAPITDLALEYLSRLKNGDTPENIIYTNQLKNGVPLRSATLPIFGEKKRIIGMICFNFHSDIPLNQFLASLVNIDSSHTIRKENYPSDLDDMIGTSLEEIRTKVNMDHSIPANLKHKEIVRQLYERNIFQLKDAVGKAADMLGISKNTIYMHIRSFNAEKS